MKPQLLDELKKQYDSVHGCYRPEGGLTRLLGLLTKRQFVQDFGCIL